MRIFVAFFPGWNWQSQMGFNIMEWEIGDKECSMNLIGCCFVSLIDWSLRQDFVQNSFATFKAIGCQHRKHIRTCVESLIFLFIIFWDGIESNDCFRIIIIYSIIISPVWSLRSSPAELITNTPKKKKIEENQEIRLQSTIRRFNRKSNEKEMYICQ